MCAVASVVCNSLWPPEWTVACQAPWDCPGKNTGVGCHALLQGLFPTQGSNPHLLHLLYWQGGRFFTRRHLRNPQVLGTRILLKIQNRSDDQSILSLDSGLLPSLILHYCAPSSFFFFFFTVLLNNMGFPCGSACNVEDLGLIPGLVRSLEKGKATHSSILAWRIPLMYSPWGHKELNMTERLSHLITASVYCFFFACFLVFAWPSLPCHPLSKTKCSIIVYTFKLPERKCSWCAWSVILVRQNHHVQPCPRL